MNPDDIHPDCEPSPEQFAAYLDGELETDAGIQVEAWLNQNLAAAEEIDGQRKLMRLWQTSVPDEPSGAAWAAAFDRIEAKVRPASRLRRSMRRTLWASAGMAAAVLVGFMLTRHFQAGAGKDATSPIESRRNVETTEEEPILLASQEDVSVVNVEPYWQDGGRVPAIGEGDVSMIVAAPLDREP